MTTLITITVIVNINKFLAAIAMGEMVRIRIIQNNKRIHTKQMNNCSVSADNEATLKSGGCITDIGDKMTRIAMMKVLTWKISAFMLIKIMIVEIVIKTTTMSIACTMRFLVAA